MLGCAKLKGMNVSSRSAAIKDEIAKFCRVNAIPCSVEPMLVSNPDGTKLRADVRISLPEEDVFVDVVVTTGGCKTHENKSQTALDEEVALRKEDLYLRPVNSMGGSFVTFSVETMGKISKDATTLAKRLEKISHSRRTNVLIPKIAVALHRFNGAIVANALRSTATRPRSGGAPAVDIPSRV